MKCWYNHSIVRRRFLFSLPLTLLIFCHAWWVFRNLLKQTNRKFGRYRRLRGRNLTPASVWENDHRLIEMCIRVLILKSNGFEVIGFLRLVGDNGHSISAPGAASGRTSEVINWSADTDLVLKVCWYLSVSFTIQKLHNISYWLFSLASFSSSFSLIEFFFNLTHETVPSPTSFIASSATCRYAHFELGCVNRLYVRCPEKLDNVQAGNPVPAQKYGGFCGL